MGVDHARAYNDPEHGASLWCLGCLRRRATPASGEALVRRLAEHFKGPRLVHARSLGAP